MPICCRFTMNHYWTWSGTYFGYRHDDLLFTHNGKCVGRFSGDEVYGRDGRYLGEVQNENRLITSRSKSSRRGSPPPNVRGAAYARYTSYVGYVMYAGYEDFPSPERF